MKKDIVTRANVNTYILYVYMEAIWKVPKGPIPPSTSVLYYVTDTDPMLAIWLFMFKQYLLSII